ncbi:MAG: Thermophilic metalloprotease (M29) superfamily [uncultured bacterium (gcode 4)]|uniref:Thermophilic metalloprotease (M29) superfamily n=1 Tax=uncultured bacterium (gcode 4) TaxID=1234023 RepID=K1XJK3_9BACT|nr:MAG: Thermophilic metalloprotease (M29) superfamily [uncultured bacterium (gcode 4)]
MYIPSQEMLKKYADVLVKFALRGGEWAKVGETVFVQIPECAKPFYLPLQKAILEVGAHPIMEYLPDDVAKHFFEHANDDQIVYYPSHFLHGKVEQMTHVISVIAEADKHELKDIDPKKLAARIHSRKEYKEKRVKKEMDGKMTRTLGLYGTQAMADEVGMSLEEYRNQIIKACYLDYDDPIAERKRTFKNTEEIKNKLNALQIEYVHVVWEDADIKIKIWSNRQRLGWGWRNIPSFEIFTSPDRRETNGWMRFNQPLYHFGQIIKDIYLKFENGIIVDFDASENKEGLKEMINIPNANKLWEFSLTDGRFSHITKFMGETLYDENVWGPEWNTHVAIGSAYNETYIGDASKLTDKEVADLGFNQSAEHTDIISTKRRTVTATLADGSEKIIYQNGQFTV